jgi:hypothetical protein
MQQAVHTDGGSGRARLRRGHPVGIVQLAGDLGSYPIGGLTDPPGSTAPLDQRGRNPIAVAWTSPAPLAAVLRGVGAIGIAEHAVDLLARPLTASVGVDRGVRGDLRAIDGDGAELPEP